MKKHKLNILSAILIAGLVVLYIINPLNKLIELNGWYSYILFGLVILSAVNKSKIVNIIFRILGASFFIYLLLYYFL